MYYLCIENKGADQLCFCICIKPVFSLRDSYETNIALIGLWDPNQPAHLHHLIFSCLDSVMTFLSISAMSDLDLASQC